MKRIKKIFFGVAVLNVWALSSSVCKAMYLAKFDKPITDIFDDASLFLLSIIGGIALLMIILGSVLYVFAGANPEAQTKAKKTVTWAIIGLIFALISYAVINVVSDISA